MTEEKKYEVTLKFSKRQAKEFVSEMTLKMMSGEGTGMVDAASRWIASELTKEME